MLIIDKLAYQNRWSQRSPLGKLLGYGVMLVLAFSAPWWLQLGECAVVMALTCYLLRVTFGQYLRWLLVPLLFLFASLPGILLSWSPSVQRLVWSVPLGAGWLGMAADSIHLAATTFCRSLAAVVATYWFVLTTPFQQQIRLLQRGRVPSVLIEHMVLTYRFIFILLEEAAQIRQAQSLRFGYCSVRTSYHSLSMLVGLLLQRVFIRYRQMEIALDIKLFQGDFHL